MTTENKTNELRNMCDGSRCCDCNLGRAGFEDFCIKTEFGNMSDKAIDVLYNIAFPENASADSEPDNVNHPAHYQGAHECIEVMQALFGVEAVKAFCRCNAFKYHFRADWKNGVEGIKKAEWYEDYLIKLCDSERKEHT